MSHATERTRLLSDQTKPPYVFESSITRERKKRIKQFQCCLCVIFLSIVLIALVVSIMFSIQMSEDTSDEDNSTDKAPPLNNSLVVLLGKSWPLPDNTVQEETYDNDTEWENAEYAGAHALYLRDEIEKDTPTVPLTNPSYKHQKVTATSDRARQLSREGYKQEFATKYLTDRCEALKNTRICQHKIQNNEFCKAANDSVNCSEFQKFRSYNGTCNNLEHPDYGVAYRPFRRALPPDYADGMSQPRVASDKGPLPSARTVSLIVHPPYHKNNEKFTVVLAVWGQFLDHDITATALSKGANGSAISCCSQTEPSHPECFPVKLDHNDPIYLYTNVTCMEFVRSAPAPTCCLGPREQMSQTTPFIDGSVIYGVDEDLVKQLRTMESGKLEMYVTEDNRTLLPISKDLNDGCNRKKESEKGRYCFMTGDARSNENLHLTSLHLIWARHHNDLAQKLADLNPHWDDERIFQEARRILGAQMQHITYKEFLPILLGPALMKKSHLNPQSSGYFTKYNDSIDPSIANNFATAAFRFAHSIIPGLMKFLANDTSSPEFVQLHKMLFDPFKLYLPGELDRALRGAMDTSIEASDTYFTSELKDHLFENIHSKDEGKACGLDLVSLNIQRGRDHGLVGYNSWREHCGLRRARTFDQLRDDIDDESLRNIKSVYRNVEDIDLYSGALSEVPINGSILGPTITCLILDQFVRIKYGDRFWYENPNVFTLGQLDEIRKTSLAKIICDNADNVEFSQVLVMERIGHKNNQVMACADIPGPDFGPWKENLTHVPVDTPDGGISVKTEDLNDN